MGCDIHLFVEKKDSLGFWRSIDSWTVDKYGSIDVPYELELYNRRNYSLFALLADVRNYKEYEPICELKGFPSDASPEVCAVHKSWEGDGHNENYLSLRELLEVDWEEEHVNSGMVNDDVWESFQKSTWDKQPRSWCMGTSVPNFTQRQWTVKKKDLVDFFYSTTLEKLKALAQVHSVFEENLRIVFWFDN